MTKQNDISNFEDGILLRIRRKYSEDEEMQFVLDRLKRAERECGILKSELAECRDTMETELQKTHSQYQQELEKKKRVINDLEHRIRVDIRHHDRDRYISILETKVKLRGEQIKKMKLERNSLISKIFGLTSKLESQQAI